MPGILPMKVIKVGTSSQSRIAQACDRCRSKKIRCDGIRPCCSQCANVGFECRTSDKLSRRAFPRGYTESLEERVRVLEAEVRDLKDLLDEKDEKIDMLSKMHGNNNSSNNNNGSRRMSIGSGSNAASPVDSRLRRELTPPREDTFRVQASPLLLGVENSDSYFMGASSGRGFIEGFKRKMQENGKPCAEFNAEAFLHIQGCYPLVATSTTQPMRIPPRLFTDRCVNVYFQEWAPLFPVLHKPSFLRTYEDFVADPDKAKNNHKLAQVYLVFSIAALSGDNPDLEQIDACEQHWHQALEAILMENTMITLQCLVLAIMYCTVRADYKRLQHYKAIAVGLSHRLGLHQSQKRFSFGALTIETRKKVFWTLYTLDCFSAATLGLPKLLKEDEIYAEYPSDTDDEYVTEKGFQPTLPGEYTRLSSALALFRGARILAKVLEKNYPAATTHDLSLQQMSALETELDDWSDNLPQHLKLTFKQDKPSTDVTGSRSPLLALCYYYTRTLIYRPAVGSSLGPKAAPALMSVSESSKHMIQIVQLLEERSMSFSFCLNKTDLLVLCGMTLLYQSLDLKQDSRMLKDTEKLTNAVIKIAERMKAPGTHDFKRVASLLITVDEPPHSLPTPPRQSPDTSMAAPPLHSRRASPPAPPERKSSKQKATPLYSLGRHPSASMSETDLLMQQEKLRRMTMPSFTPSPPTAVGLKSDANSHRPASRSSFDNAQRPDPATLPPQRRDHHRLFMSQAAMIARVASSANQQKSAQNLDYLSLSNTPAQSSQNSPVHTRFPQQQQQQQTQRQQQQQQHVTTTAPTNQVYAVHHHQQQQQKIPGGTGTGTGTGTDTDWEAMLGQIDSGQVNLYDAIYGGPQVSLDTPPQQQQPHPVSAAPLDHSSSGSSNSNNSNNNQEWCSPEALDMSHFNLGEFGQSVPSLSDHESLSSVSGGDDMGSLDFRDFHHQGGGRQSMMASADGFVLGELDGNFGM